jgi:hypothetical protein
MLHFGTADFMMQVLRSAPKGWGTSLRVGDLPVKLWVIDREGLRLRQEPSEDSLKVESPFKAIIFADQVTWEGKYHIGVDGKGNRRVYYYVTYEFNGKVYEGWVPSEYTQPEIVSLRGFKDYRESVNDTFLYEVVDGWERYNTSGAAQYLNLELLFKDLGFGDHTEYANPHFNLCGELAVMEAVGASLEDGFRMFGEMGEYYQSILQAPDRETSSRDLEDFFDQFGWDAERKSGQGEDDLEVQLMAGKSVLALVTIDNGLVSGDGTISHWVRVKNIDDESVIIYNPYSNREEIVDLETFMSSWDNVKETPGNIGVDHLLVVAGP